MTPAIAIDQAAQRNLKAGMMRLQRETGRTCDHAVAYALGLVAQSAAKAAKPGKPKRPIVENPHEQAKTDARRAKFGVEVYRQGHPKKFVPIYRTGQFGNIRFTSRKTAQYTDHWTTMPDGKRRRVNRETGTQAGQIGGIDQSPKRIIRHAGLARRVFHAARGAILSMGKADARNYELGRTMTLGDRRHIVRQYARGGGSIRVVSGEIVARLSYLDAAYPNLIASATASAARGLHGQIDRGIAKATAAAFRGRAA